MIEQAYSMQRLYICVLIGLLAIVTGCKKDDSRTDSGYSIDSALVNVWYSSRYDIGFDIARDGTTQPVKKDTSGKLNYISSGTSFSLPGFGILNSLKIMETSHGNLKASIYYKTPSNTDTVEVILGTYVFTNSGNLLTITMPYTGQQNTLEFQKSKIGESPS
jgi:hypothetical protein